MARNSDLLKNAERQRQPSESASVRAPRLIPLKVALQYALIAGAWILLSDRVLSLVVGNQAELQMWQSAKGIFFVTVTACLLALMVDRYVRRLRRARENERQSEERLRLAVRATKLGVWEWNLHNDRAFASSECCEILGCSDFDGSCDSLLREMQPDDAAWFGRMARAAASERAGFSLECRIVPADGVTRWVSVFGEPYLDEAGAVQRLVGTVQDVTKRHLADETLARSEAELAAIYEHAPVMMLLLDENLNVRRINRSAMDFAGFEANGDEPVQPGDIIGCFRPLGATGSCSNGVDCSGCVLRAATSDTLATGVGRTRVEFCPGSIGGKPVKGVTMLVSTAPVSASGKRMVLVCLEDVTEQRRLELQFIEAQKSEALGQLAGGIAHDFNNLLTATLLNVELTKRSSDLTPAVAEALSEIEEHSRRAAGLTRQLLLFSRKQVLQMHSVHLDQVIRNLLKLIGRLLGENITIQFHSAPSLPEVLADTGMIEQVLMNLCINARDAMPRGGTLLIETKSVDIEPDQLGSADGMRPGRFVCLNISDTGTGIEDEVLERIFEPFYTTKESGKGTGLGLASVLGIVKQHQGWVEVRSQLHSGSSFRVYLPVAHEGVVAPARSDRVDHAPQGSESILLVEDEPGVRWDTSRVLRDRGYRVIEAKNGADAMDKWRAHAGEFELLLTDMVMPDEMTGLELSEKLRSSKPRLKVVITSGYNPEAPKADSGASRGFVFLQKPCSGSELTTAVRRALDGAA